MKNIRRLVLILLVGVIVAVSAFLFLLFRNRERFIVDNGSFGSKVSRVDASLKVGIIGDSWAAGEKLDAALKKELQAVGLKPSIVSYGHSGGKSRDVLRDLCQKSEARKLIDDDEIDVFVIMVGVNDSKGHDGPDFYGFHVQELLSLIESHGALAVVIDVPQYGIDSIEAPSFAYWCKRQASRMLFDSGESDNRPAYRQKLREVTNADPHVAIVQESSIPSYYESPNLWRDPAHLNEEGYKQAAIPIAAAVAKIYETALKAN